MSSKRTVSTFGGPLPPRRCGLLDCKAMISADDPHTVCISCLGVAHAFNALKYPDAPDRCDTCSHYSERFLRSRYEAARAFAGLSPEPHRGDGGAYEASGAIVAYRRDRRQIREAFDDHLSNQREVTYQRVVNVVERRTTTNRSEVAYDRGYDDDQRYYSSRNAPDQRSYRGENTYPPDDRSYMDEHLKQYPSARPIPQLEEPPYGSPREDFLIRRQVEISSGRDRAGPYVSSRGQGLSPLMTVTRMSDRGDNKLMSSHSHAARGDDYDDYPPWRESSLNTSRDRSPPPPRREVQTSVVPSAQGSGSSSRSYTPERDTGYTYQQLQQRRYEDPLGHKIDRENPRVSASHTPPPSGSAAGSPPRSSMAVQEELPASVKEPENDVVMVVGSTEPKLTPEEDLKARRAKAITAKAFEIEKLYRQDCETFGTVVKMLADKEPALEPMLKAPLTENLLEIKQRCLDDLSHFIKELDQAMELDQAIQPSEVISV